MDEKRNEQISYFAMEGIMTHISMMFKMVVKLSIAVLISATLIIVGLIWYMSLPVEESESVTVENEDGNANYIGSDMNGDFNYGESKENSN